MIFQHTIEQVLNGTKTQTRRVADEGDSLRYLPITHTVIAGGFASSRIECLIEVVNASGNRRWSVGGE